MIYKNDKKIPFVRKVRPIIKEDKNFYQRFVKLCRDNFDEKNNIYYSFGYETFGIILYGFCKWLLDNLKKNQIKRIIFLSRDGYIIKEAFNLMPGSEEFQTDYMYVSRRSLRVPQLWKADKNERQNAICATKYISLEDLFSSVGLDVAEYKNILKKYGLKKEQVIKDVEISSNEKIEAMLDDIWQDVVRNSLIEYESLKQYLKQYRLQGKVAVVDIGWRGSMQFFLSEILEMMHSDVALQGYYITLSSSMIKGLNMYGYLGNVTGDGEGCDLLRGYAGLIELMFLKTEGSVEKYMQTKDGRGVPKLYEYEYFRQGKYTDEVSAVLQIQNGALSFIKDCENSELKNMEFHPITAFQNLSQIANHPRLKDINLFKNFKFYNNGTSTYLTGANSLAYNLTHLKKFKEDLYGSRWRIGFLKRVFKMPMPYHLIFSILMRIAM